MKEKLIEPEPVQMVFNFNPITGLEYTSGIEPILIYPIDMLPKKVKLDIESVMHHIKHDKVLFINSGKERVSQLHGLIFSNF